MALQSSGILDRAGQAREAHLQGEQNDLNYLDEADAEIERLSQTATGGGSGGGATKSEIEQKKRTSPEDTSVLSETEPTTVKDNKNNEFKVPANFGIAYDSANNVADGIVIEDGNHNQYVWIPVGTSITKDDEVGTVIPAITLGRYAFDVKAEYISGSWTITGAGAATLVQDATSWATATVIKPSSTAKYGYYEYAADNAAGSSFGNTKANNLQNFVEHTISNGGYYIARYEAGIAGTTDNNSNSTKADWNNTKPLSKAGVGVWNSITQPNAAIACQGMYTSCTSDLMNSFAWDTAIVFIQAVTGSNDYAKQNRGSNTSLLTTGTTGDVRCNIYDLSKNIAEWITETGTYSDSGGSFSCVHRGGSYNSDTIFTSHRAADTPTTSYDGFGFRPLLYL